MEYNLFCDSFLTTQFKLYFIVKIQLLNRIALIFSLHLLPCSLWSQVQLNVLGEGGTIYSNIAGSQTRVLLRPTYISQYKSPNIKIKPVNNAGYYFSCRVEFYSDSNERFGFYSGLNWSKLRSSFMLLDIPDSFYSSDQVEVQLRQQSFLFNLGFQRRLLKSKSLTLCVGGTIDYTTYPKFSSEQDILVNTYALQQVLFGINFAIGTFIPRTNRRVMLRYSFTQPFGAQFSNTIQHQLNRSIEYAVLTKYSYHQLGLTIRII